MSWCFFYGLSNERLSGNSYVVFVGLIGGVVNVDVLVFPIDLWANLIEPGQA